ncbi:MAG: sulfotransferase, partial [Pseudomonadota bacterium]
EQILASHDQIVGGGEMTFFPSLVTRLAQAKKANEQFPACLKSDCSELLDEARAQYLALLESLATTEVAYVSDKMPYNFLYVGLICATLPDARFIHCRRDPKDTCVSIFTHDLAGNHPYSYDLEELTQAYRNYERVMAHWVETFPEKICTVDYEALLEDPKAQIKRLVEFLALDWQQQCLNFHHNQRTVTTASNWQVRQPLYSSSVSRWRRYQNSLGPLLAAFPD